nr:cytochrome P450 [Actinomycetota bacterium]
MVATSIEDRAQPAVLPRPPRRAQVRYLRTLLRDPQPVLDELRDRYGPVCGLGFGPARMAIVGGPEALRDLFAHPVGSFRWGHKFNALGFVVGDGSMIVSDGPDHERRRSSVQAAFSRKRLNSWIPTIVERTDAAADRLLASEPTGPVDLYRVGRALVLDIVVRSLFGERLAARAEEIGALFQRPQDYLESPAVRQLPHPFPYTTRARVRADRRAIDAIIDGEIADHRAHRVDEPGNVLAALVDEGRLTDAEIRDQVATLIGAGYDTTSASFAWIVWRAALQPGLWDRIGAEAEEVLGTPGKAIAIDHSHLARLDLAARTMREALRLHPAGAISPREAAVDVTVGGYRIPKGTLILWSAHLAGRDPSAWPDALAFDPDRFDGLTPQQQAVSDAAWVPFGRGARSCIGFALAQMELTLII